MLWINDFDVCFFIGMQVTVLNLLDTSIASQLSKCVQSVRHIIILQELIKNDPNPAVMLPRCLS